MESKKPICLWARVSLDHHEWLNQPIDAAKKHMNDHVFSLRMSNGELLEEAWELDLEVCEGNQRGSCFGSNLFGICCRELRQRVLISFLLVGWLDRGKL